MKNRTYSLVATGGTFDRLHKGHEALLSKAFSVSDKVIIGVTSDEMVKRNKKVLKEEVMPYEKRVEDVKRYLKEKGWLGREVIAKLNDVYGPTVIENPIEAVVCTRETRFGAVAINKARRNKKHPLVDIIECKFVVSDDNRHISSTRIRLGEIDRNGIIFSKQQYGQLLPEDLRSLFHKPIGPVYNSISEALKTIKKNSIVCIVGDYTYLECKKIKFIPQIVIIDGYIGRDKAETDKIKPDFIVTNPPGKVTRKLITTCKRTVNQVMKNRNTRIVKIKGEDDLAVAALILTLPLNSVVFYGQPPRYGNSGTVKVVVDEEKKLWIRNLLERFI